MLSGMIKKLIRILLFSILALVAVVILFVLVSVIPVDRTPYYEKAFYAEMQFRLDSLQDVQVRESVNSFSAGYAKVNLTPPYRTATAGYAKRKGALFSYVHDSIYVRTMVVDNGTATVALVTADLLLIPPTV